MLVFVIWLLFWQFPCLIYEVDAFPMVSVANDNWNNVFDKEIYIIMVEIVWRELQKLEDKNI